MVRATGPLVWEWSALTDELHLTSRLQAIVGRADTRAAWRARVRDEDRARYAQVVDAALAACARWTVRYHLCGCDGDGEVEVEERGYPVRADRELVRVLGVLSFAGEPLGQATLGEHELRQFVEMIPQLAWSMDANGWIHFYNRRWYDYTGTRFDDMAGWGWLAVHDPYDLPRILRIWERALETGEAWEDEFRLRQHDGQLRWHLSRAMPIRDARGQVTHWIGTNTDVHDQKLAAEEYSRLLASEQRARREAEEANRAKDEFLAVVSHELRTPLHVILGWIEILRLPGVPSEKQADVLAKIASNARLQAKLVEDLLDVSRIITGKLQIELVPVAVAAAVRAAVDAARPMAEEKAIALTLREHVGPSLAIRGDAARLQQIFGNLLGNAVKFTPSGGAITVSTAEHGGRVAIEVADTGIGFDPRFTAEMFQRFRQSDASTTRRHGGLGLGLAIARELVQRHGGDIEAFSAGPNRGARLKVWFPIASADQLETPAVSLDPSDVQAVRLTGIRVLVVDDNAYAREVLAETLLGCGATVSVVSSVHEALRAFKLDVPDVIVSDIGMPELDGYSLAHRVRAMTGERERTVPMIALTAYASLSDRERAEAAGFDRYLAKPADAARLSHVIAALVSARTVAGLG